MGVLEDEARELRDTHPEIAGAVLVAADLLDCAAADGTFGAWSGELDDLTWLVGEVDHITR